MELENQTVNFGSFINASTLDYRKYVSSVFFLRGCNLNCYECQNREICKGQDYRELDDIKKMIDDTCFLSSAIVFSGGECTLQEDVLFELCKYARDGGFKTAIQTNGTNPNVIKKLIESGNLDKVSMDVKTTWEKYLEFTNVGIDYTDEIKESIDICRKAMRHGSIEDYEIITTAFKLNSEDVVDISYYFDNVNYIINNGVIDYSEELTVEELVEICNLANNKNEMWIRSKECGECLIKDGKMQLSNGMGYI